MNRTLLWRIVPHNGGVVFALQERAEYVAALHRALGTAKTWGQFRAAIPRKEYSESIAILDEIGEPRHKSTDRFEAEQVPGWSDGDYPPWLQQEMSALLPTSILEQFGTQQQTFINSSYWHILPDRVSEMVQCLKEQGFNVREAAALPFHWTCHLMG
jgi:hypothetical protein